jgi:RimJ/RimL family protein N-acetyltransferase
MVTLQTRRMTLHALTLEQLSMALNDLRGLEAELRARVSPEVFSEESRQAMTIKISRMEYNERKVHPWFTYFLLVRSDDRTAMGVCGFKGSPSLFGAVELGYAIHETFRNQGLMSEAVTALVEWAFGHENCSRVTAETLRENYASQRVLQKSGLTLDRAAENMLYWKIDRQEWAERRAANPAGGAGARPARTE